MSGDITKLLLKCNEGDPSAKDKLFDVIRSELRKMAQANLQNVNSYNTLQPTILVTDTFMKLIEQKRIDWENSEQFYAYAWEVMKNIVADRWRKHNAKKRIRDSQQISINEAKIDFLNLSLTEEKLIALIDLNEALDSLMVLDSLQYKIALLHHYYGFKMQEVAKMLSISYDKAEREWTAAKAWLNSRLRKSD